MPSFMGIVSNGANSAADIEMTNKDVDVYKNNLLLSGVQLAIFACVLLSS